MQEKLGVGLEDICKLLNVYEASTLPAEFPMLHKMIRDRFPEREGIQAVLGGLLDHVCTNTPIMTAAQVFHTSANTAASGEHNMYSTVSNEDEEVVSKFNTAVRPTEFNEDREGPASDANVDSMVR